MRSTLKRHGNDRIDFRNGESDRNNVFNSTTFFIERIKRIYLNAMKIEKAIEPIVFWWTQGFKRNMLIF